MTIDADKPAYGRKRRVAKIPPLSGRERASRRRNEGEDCLSVASSAAPDDGAACDRLGPITAAALLGSFFSLLRRMNISCHPARDAGSRKVNLTGNLVGVTRCRIQVRHDRSAKPSGLWEKAERKMTEWDEQGKKMFEPGRINRRARGSKACRTAATGASPASSFSPDRGGDFSAFGHQPGAFFWLSLFFCGKRKGETRSWTFAGKGYW